MDLWSQIRTPEEIVGHAYLEYSNGRISREELDGYIERAKTMETTAHRKEPRTPGYA